MSIPSQSARLGSRPSSARPCPHCAHRASASAAVLKDTTLALVASGKSPLSCSVTFLCEPKQARGAGRSGPRFIGFRKKGSAPSCQADSQLFSDPGNKGNPVWGRPFLVQPPKKRGKRIGATEQLRRGPEVAKGKRALSFLVETNPPHQLE